MRRRPDWALALGPMVLLATCTIAQADESVLAAIRTPSRLLVYEQPGGSKYFVLSLTAPPEVFGAAASARQGVDVVLLFDTSASQTGPYRVDSLAALRTLLATLSPADRVKLLAVDLAAVEMHTGFAPPASEAMQAAVKQLERREPLGSTDLAAGLQAAIKSFDVASKRPRAVVYFGDGMSKANFLTTDEFSDLTRDLVAARVPVHSYAIGPQRDMQLLAALANHTGGMMYVDSAEENVAQKAGSGLARVASAPVFWPTDVVLPSTLKEVFPSRTPPFRPDRDTILLGVLEGEGPQSIAIQGETFAGRSRADWKLTPEPTGEDLAYLAQLVDMVRRDGGALLPTAGMEGLHEVGRLMLARAESLVKMGARQLATGDLRGAQKLAEAAQKTDPKNPQAQSIQRSVLKMVEEQQKQPTPAEKPAPAKAPGITPSPKAGTRVPAPRS